MCALPIKMRSHSSADKSLDYDFSKLIKKRRLLKKLKQKKFRAKKKLKLLKKKNLSCQKKVIKDIINFINLAAITNSLAYTLNTAFMFNNIKNMANIFFMELSAAYSVLNNHKNLSEKMMAAKNIKARTEDRNKIAQRLLDYGDDSGYFRLGRG